MNKLVLLSLPMFLLLMGSTDVSKPSEPSVLERSKFMEQCSLTYQEFECFILFRYGTYPTQPLVDMRGSPMDKLIESTVEPIPTPRRRPASHE